MSTSASFGTLIFFVFHPLQASRGELGRAWGCPGDWGQRSHGDTWWDWCQHLPDEALPGHEACGWFPAGHQGSSRWGHHHDQWVRTPHCSVTRISACTLSTVTFFSFWTPSFVSSVDHVTPEPGDSLLEAFECWQEAADKKACCDYSLHVDIPQWNENVKDELEVLVHEKGTASLFRCSPVIFQSCGRCWCSCFSATFIPNLDPFHRSSRDRLRNNLAQCRILLQWSLRGNWLLSVWCSRGGRVWILLVICFK